MNEIQQEIVMIKSGVLGRNLNLQEMVTDGFIRQAGADAYLEEIGSSGKVVINDNEADNGSGIRAMV